MPQWCLPPTAILNKKKHVRYVILTVVLTLRLLFVTYRSATRRHIPEDRNWILISIQPFIRVYAGRKHCRVSSLHSKPNGTRKRESWNWLYARNKINWSYLWYSIVPFQLRRSQDYSDEWIGTIMTSCGSIRIKMAAVKSYFRPLLGIRLDRQHKHHVTISRILDDIRNGYLPEWYRNTNPVGSIGTGFRY
jgi:hypothetical protein